MVDALRVAFFGTPQFAVPTLQTLLDARHTVCGVVTQPDRPRGRGQQVSDSPVKALAVERGLPLLQPARLKDPASCSRRASRTRPSRRPFANGARTSASWRPTARSSPTTSWRSRAWA